MSTTAGTTDSNLSGKPSDNIDKQTGPSEGSNAESPSSTLVQPAQPVQEGNNQAAKPAQEGNNQAENNNDNAQQQQQQNTSDGSQ